MKTSKTTSSRGFTLIELLVVIAIIGILSAVVLGSLLLGRLKAEDASIKANLHTIQTQIELYYSNNANKYGTTDFSCQPSAVATVPVNGNNAFIQDPTVNNALKSALAQGGGGLAYWAVGQGGSSYAVEVQLKADSTKWWCIDSSGTPKTEPQTGPNAAGNLGGGAATIAACPP